MKKDKNLIICTIISVLISVIVYGGAWAIGFFCMPKNAIYSRAVIVSGVVTGLAAIINVLVYVFQTRRLKSFTVKQANDYLEAKKSVIERDCRKAEKKIDRNIKLTISYAVLLLVLVAALTFTTAVSDLPLSNDDSGASLLLAIFAVAFMQGVVRFLIFKPTLNEPDAKRELPKDSFPLLYGLVEECASNAEIDKQVRLFFSSDTIGISQYKKQMCIFLNPVEVALMTKDELKAIIMHEFAHERNSDIQLRLRHDSFHEKEGGWLFLGAPISFVKLDIDVYREVSSRAHEARADEYVVRCGMAQNYVNAIAKGELFYIYSGYEWKETSYDTYVDEKPVDDFMHRELDNFKRRLVEYRDRWFFTLNNELPQRIDTHPTFKMRREACRIETFDVDKTETDENYLAEVEALLNFADKTLHDGYDLNEYLPIRSENYVYRTKLFKKAEAEGDSFAFASDNEQLELAQAYVGYDNAKALAIARQVISRSDNTLAYFLAGMLLSWEYDDECIAMFKKAAETSAFFEEAYDRLAVYALRTGKADLIKDYRETVVEKTQAFIDEDALTDINRITLCKPTVGAVENEIINELKKYWGESLISVHLAEYVGDNGITAKYYAIELENKPSADYNNNKVLTDDLFFRMTNPTTKYYLFYFGDGLKKIKSVKGSKIYSAK